MQPMKSIGGLMVGVAAVAFLGIGSRVAGQSRTAKTGDEKAIRSLIHQENEGKQAIKYTNESIFVSGVYPRPVIGSRDSETVNREVMSKRSNVSRQDETVRLVISKSRDIAYEYGNFKMSFDDAEKRKISFSGSYLRVWRKAGGEWRVDALFAKPNPEGQ